MQNIDVRFRAATDFAQAKTDIAALNAQVDKLNASLREGALGSGKGPMVLDAGRWANAAKAVEVASSTYRDAASSSGLFTTQQIRAISETERFTKALQQQKLTLGDMRKNWGIMQNVYRDQLRMQRMTAQYWGTDSMGRAVTDITLPKQVPTELDNWRRKMGMFGNMAASAGTQVVNLGKNIQWSGRQLTVGFTYPMVLFGAAAGVMAYKTTQAFASINKVYDFSAAAQKNEVQMVKEQGELRTQSLKNAENAAKQYGSSLESTLKVEQELAATGLKGQNLMGTTTQVQRFSALGDIDPDQTEKMVIAMQTAFHKTIPDAKTLTDTLNYMNAASNATSLSLQDIAEATPRAASGFAQLGGDAKQMTVLLVAMREAGVEAAQGANALKSASTRIINPVPKALDFYKQYKINLEEIAKESGGNLFKYLEIFGREQNKIQGKTEKQTNLLRAQGVATLFGTYQNNRLTAALVNLSEAYGGANNQTSKALALMKQTPAELAKTAEASRKAMMDNPAGRFREEWAQFQIQLQQMGQPFLSAADDILHFFTVVAKGFNNAPSWVKKTAGIGAAVAALAGPLIMVTGLMFNMVGQIIKGVGGFAKLVGISKIYTKEQMAAELTTKAQNEQLALMAQNTESNIALTDTFAREVQVLQQAMTQAMEQITFALSDASQGEEALAAASGNAATAVMEDEVKKQASIEDTIATIRAETDARIAQSQAFASYGQYVPATPMATPKVTATGVPPVVATGYRGESIMVADTAGQARAQAAAEAKVAAATRESALRSEIANKANAEAVIQQKTSKYVNGTSVSMGIMTASMATMMLTSNSTAQNIAKWALIGTLVVPALGMALRGAQAFGAKMVESVVAAKAAMVAQRAATAETVGAAGGLRAAASAGIGGAVGMINPLTAALTLVGAIGVGMYMWHKHEQEVIQDQVDSQNALTDAADAWAQSVGRVERNFKGIKSVIDSISQGQGFKPDLFRKDLDFYQTGGGKAASEKLGTLSPDDKDTSVLNTYVNLVGKWGLTAKEARANITALLVASGEDFFTATQEAKRYATELGNMKGHQMDWNAAVKAQGQFLSDIINNSDKSTAKMKELTDAATNFGRTFGQTFKDSTTPEEAQRLMDHLNGVFSEGWKKIYDNAKSTQLGTSFLDAHNLTNANQFRNFAENDPNAKNYAGQIGVMVTQQQAYQQAIVGSIAKALLLKGDIKDISDLQDNLVVRAKEWNLDTTKKQVLDIGNAIMGGPLAGILGVKPTGKGPLGADMGAQFKQMLKSLPTKEVERLVTELNTIAFARGVKTGSNAWQTYKNILASVGMNIDTNNRKLQQGANDTDNLGNKLRNLPTMLTVQIQAKQVPGIIQTAMQGVEQDMATGADNALQQRQTAASNAQQAQQQAAQTRLQNQQQAAQNAMDRRFQAREDAINKSFQKRIDAINKEIAAEQHADAVRQQLYEKEKARIQQLADMQNNTIDFNQAVDEGRLQDAAKTLNNAEAASLQNEMDNELQAEQNRTQARVEALQKKTDRLEKQRDNELKTLQKLEDREKQHLQKVQEMRSQALQKQQAAETAALQASQDAEKQNLDAKLALFQSYVATNQKDLEQWMHKVGLTYDDFGKDITNKGESWANSFQVALQQHIRAAGMAVVSDNMWQAIGKNMAGQLLEGIGFPNKGAFTNFVKNGVLPKNFGETHHGGGVVGDGSTDRSGKTGSLNRDERYVLAQDGERIINKASSDKYDKTLRAIDKGTWDGIDRDARGGMSFKDNPGGVPQLPAYRGSFAPATGVVAGGMANLFEAGVGIGIRKAVKAAEQRMKRGTMGRPGEVLDGYVPGPGGLHRPIGAFPLAQGIHDQETGYPAVDIAAPIGSKIYAVDDGVVTVSKDYRGYEPRRMIMGQTGQGVQDGFRSYGRVMYLRTKGGDTALYAHLSQRGVGEGAQVKGGSVIGRSGNTGNVQSSSGNGAHLHFGSNPLSPYAFLRKGGKLKWDNTMVMGHKGETMLSAPVTKKFEDRVANGDGNHYDITIDMTGSVFDSQIDFEAGVENALNKIESRKGRTKVIRSKVGSNR